MKKRSFWVGEPKYYVPLEWYFTAFASINAIIITAVDVLAVVITLGGRNRTLKLIYTKPITTTLLTLIILPRIRFQTGLNINRIALLKPTGKIFCATIPS